MNAPYSPALSAQRSPSPRHLAAAGTALLALALSACDLRGATSGAIAYPDDTAITKALRIDWDSDPAGQQAQALLHTLGGPGASVRYRIHRVIAQPVGFLVQYDAVVQLQQDGAQSLQQFQQQLAAQLAQQAQQSAAKGKGDNAPAAPGQQAPQPSGGPGKAELQKAIEQLRDTQAEQAQALERMLHNMQQCYQERHKGDEVVLMARLRAHLWPERNQGWYAEKIAAPDMQIACLPL
ncbi:hypothetical protein EBQ34_13955 [Vandammella animalimorsus]|uniref:Uncharacterized protein n=1 Tax=Vandammella animalimorsus TaxID=2029117 RepID=A0A3M6R1Z4_9BURK|nr:hypothetical protein [Vandammella animalimorsus]RMX09213.1 hypothetical protein EBQ34_13955 [Vandammella animalimorsus]